MAVIAIYSVKGGVGKTTLATNLAWCSAASAGRETVVWDLDPSGGAGFLLGAAQQQTSTASALFNARRDARRLTVNTDTPKLSLLPADEGLRAIESKLEKMGNRSRISQIVRDLDKDYERIFIDCPPVLSELSDQIIRAADIIIVPLPPSPLSTRAFQLVAKQVKASGKKHAPMLPVLSMVDRRRNLHLQAIKDAANWPVIPFSSAAEQCAVRQQPVGQFAGSSTTAHAIQRLSDAIEAKLEELQR